MRQESSGFWSVNSSKPLPGTQEPYILPAHCEQAFLYIAPKSSSPWKSIVPINPQGCRLFDTTYEEANMGSVREDEPTSTEPQPLITLSQEELQEEQSDDSDQMDDEKEDVAMEFDFEPPLKAQPLVALSKTLELTAEELHKTIQDNEDFELIIDLFPNYD